MAPLPILLSSGPGPPRKGAGGKPPMRRRVKLAQPAAPCHSADRVPLWRSVGAQSESQPGAPERSQSWKCGWMERECMSE